MPMHRFVHFVTMGSYLMVKAYDAGLPAAIVGDRRSLGAVGEFHAGSQLLVANQKVPVDPIGGSTRLELSAVTRKRP
jgi:hypothetical protein